MSSSIFIGTAGWSIPTYLKPKFPSIGTHLQRYAQVFNCVEINSSFYRDHKPDTYAKWTSMVPDHFRFAIKLNREFTHHNRLQQPEPRINQVLAGISELKEKWAVLLIQLPPSLEFDLEITKKFLQKLRKYYSGPVVWEPRHLSWITHYAVQLLAEFKINKVIADPEPCPIKESLRNNLEELRYFRLHGSPDIYKSRYSQEVIQELTQTIHDSASKNTPAWFIFDNTTYGYATENAMELQQLKQNY